MYGILTNPWVLLGLLLSLVASHSFAYYKGYESRDTKAKVELLKETQAKIEALEAYDKISREFVKAFHTKQVETKVIYRKIKERVKDETSGRVCFNDGASRVWDDALKGVLQETSSGTPKEASRAYTDEQVLENVVQNFELYKECRDQLNALIDWHEEN